MVIVLKVLVRPTEQGAGVQGPGTGTCDGDCATGFGTRRTKRTMNMGVEAHVVVIVAASQLMSLSSFHQPPADLPVMGSTRTPTDTSLTLHSH